MTADQLAERFVAALRRNGLRVMAGDIFTDARGAAFLVGRSMRTLQRWREQTLSGTPAGPPWHEIKTMMRGAAAYDLIELAEWFLVAREATKADMQGHKPDRCALDTTAGARTIETSN